MTPSLRTLLERLLSQEVARTNAAQASVRLTHDRRQSEAVDTFLDRSLKDHGNRPPAPGRREGR